MIRAKENAHFQVGAATNAPAISAPNVVVDGSNQFHNYTYHADLPFWGIYTATSGVMPASLGLTDVSANVNSKIPLYFTLANHN